MKGLSSRVGRMRQRIRRKRAKTKKAKESHNIKTNGQIATWKPRYLYLLDIEQLRRTSKDQSVNALTRCEKISYRAWMAAEKRRARRRPEKSYLVLNPPGPFLSVTPERLTRYLQ